MTNDWSVLCDSDRLTVARSIGGADSPCAGSLCPMRSSRRRSFCSHARTAQQEPVANRRSHRLPLLKPPELDDTSLSPSGENENTMIAERVCLSDGGPTAPAVIGSAILASRPPRLLPSGPLAGSGSDILPRACVCCSQRATLQSNCLVQSCCIRLHMHDFTLILTMSTRCVNACLTLPATRP